MSGWPQRAGIVGAGTMGRGIAQLFASRGIDTLLYDSNPAASRAALTAIGDTLNRAASKGRATREEVDSALARLGAADALAALSGCDIIVESIVEDLAVKRAVMSSLEDVVGDTCVLTTNTSSLSVAAIAASCRLPHRVAGLHFFNPAPLMKVVEVVPGGRTEPGVIDALVALVERLGHRPVRAQDTPGFLVNHAGRGYGTEALRILAEGVASPSDIDAVMRDVAGFRMGPFELLDLTGLDVSHPVMEAIYHQFYEEPRFRPSTETARRLAAGLLGRKSSEGFYSYRDGAKVERTDAPPPPDRPALAWISPAVADARARVVAFLRALPAPPVIEETSRPHPDALCIVTPMGDDATTAAVSQELDASRVVAVDTFTNWARRPTLMTTPATLDTIRRSAHGLFASGGAPVTVIRDSPGFVAQRILSTVINVSCEIAQQQIAQPRDIDDAVTLGLGYPLGPLAWGDELGPAAVLGILERLQVVTGDMRYRPSTWLRRRAQLGMSLRAPEWSGA